MTKLMGLSGTSELVPFPPNVVTCPAHQEIQVSPEPVKVMPAAKRLTILSYGHRYLRQFLLNLVVDSQFGEFRGHSNCVLDRVRIR
jgi:hypothetical protein